MLAACSPHLLQASQLAACCGCCGGNARQVERGAHAWRALSRAITAAAQVHVRRADRVARSSSTADAERGGLPAVNTALCYMLARRTAAACRCCCRRCRSSHRTAAAVAGCRRDCKAHHIVRQPIGELQCWADADGGIQWQPGLAQRACTRYLHLHAQAFQRDRSLGASTGCQGTGCVQVPRQASTARPPPPHTPTQTHLVLCREKWVVLQAEMHCGCKVQRPALNGLCKQHHPVSLLEKPHAARDTAAQAAQHGAALTSGLGWHVM
jgi:hypothetical protein